MLDRKDRVLLSDQFLKHKNLKDIFNRINEKKIKNIVIVGGSHSGFSAAWLLLNGPADIHHNSYNRAPLGSKFPEAVFKANYDCKQCCFCRQKHNC